MFINGKEINLKQFHNEYKPTPEEFAIARKVDVYHEIKDVEGVLEVYFDGATLEDLSEDELEEILDRYENHVDEYGFDALSLRSIVRNVIEQYENPFIAY